MTLAAVIIRHIRLAKHGGHPAAVDADLWMVWDDVEDRNEFIGLLNGSPYADCSPHPAAPASRRPSG
jgi:hypothetical protein